MPPRDAALSRCEGATPRWPYTWVIANATVAAAATVTAKASVTPFTSTGSGWLEGREFHDAAVAAYLAEVHDAGRASSSASMAVAVACFRAKAACFRAKVAGQPAFGGEDGPRACRVPADGRRVVAVTLTRSGSTRTSRPWDSAYHGPHGQRLAEAARAFPTLWGTSWDGLFWHPHKPMTIQSFAAEVMLTLPELVTVTDNGPSTSFRFIGSMAASHDRVLEETRTR